jgi:hypothetical protein
MQADRMSGGFSTHGRDEKCIQVIGGKHEGKIAVGRPKCSVDERLVLKWISKKWLWGADCPGGELFERR